MRAQLTGLLWVLVCLTVSGGLADPIDEPDEVEIIEQALEEGDARRLLDTAGAFVELDLPNAEDSYSRAQAIHVMKRFFDENPDGTFRFVEQKSRGERWHAVGVLSFGSGSTDMAVHIYLRKRGLQWHLKYLGISSVEPESLSTR